MKHAYNSTQKKPGIGRASTNLESIVFIKSFKLRLQFLICDISI